MQRPRVLRAFVDDVPLKVVSLVIALTLFVIVRSDKDAATGATVKVIYTLPKDKVLVSDPVGEVRVGVRGPWTRLQRFDERAVAPIRVDLSRAENGAMRFDESMIKLPPGLRVSSITPAEIQLRFEPRVEREVPIQPTLDGEPADGFRVGKVLANPQTVKVEGAQSAVEALLHATTRPLEIGGARAQVVGTVALADPPRHAHFLGPLEVEVHAGIEAAMIERTFDALPIRVLGLERLDGEVDPPEARLILRGPADLVHGVKAEDISLHVNGQLLDTRPPARYMRNIAVSGLPPGVAAEVQPDTVMLSTRRHVTKKDE